MGSASGGCEWSSGWKQRVKSGVECGCHAGLDLGLKSVACCSHCCTTQFVGLAVSGYYKCKTLSLIACFGVMLVCLIWQLVISIVTVTLMMHRGADVQACPTSCFLTNTSA